MKQESNTTISRVFEDNAAALVLANSPMPKMTPRSKHIGVKYHWFREKLDAMRIQICKIGTAQQLADIFTKGLARLEFRAKRFMMCGW